MFNKSTLIVAAIALILGFSWFSTSQRLQRLQAEYKGAQQEATNELLKLKISKELEYNELRKQKDRDYDELIGRYSDTLERLRTNTQSSSGSGPIVVSKSPGTSESSLGAGGDTYIPITLSDAYICATNTAKAQIAHEWVLSLQ